MAAFSRHYSRQPSIEQQYVVCGCIVAQQRAFFHGSSFYAFNQVDDVKLLWHFSVVALQGPSPVCGTALMYYIGLLVMD